MPIRQRRILIEQAEISSVELRFSSRNAHYLRDVLRLKPGDRISVFDGGREYAVELVTCSKEAVIGRVAESMACERESSFEMTLAFCCVRPGPFEEILRHWTEIGVGRFVPILSRRANRRPTDKKQRWESIVASAAEQSGRVLLPVVEPPQPLEDFIQRNSTGETRIVLTAAPGAVTLLGLLEERQPCRMTMLVGPEGGFDSSETSRAIQSGFQEASLTAGVLRTETAGLVAAGVAAMWYRWRSPVGTSHSIGSDPELKPVPLGE